MKLISLVQKLEQHQRRFHQMLFVGPEIQYNQNSFKH